MIREGEWTMEEEEEEMFTVALGGHALALRGQTVGGSRHCLQNVLHVPRIVSKVRQSIAMLVRTTTELERRLS